MKTQIACAMAALALACAGCARHHAKRNQDYPNFVFAHPLISPGVEFGKLPPAVRRTIVAETGSAEISGVIRDTSSGRLVYVIFFQNRDLYPPLHVAPNGSVLHPDGTIAIGAPKDTVYVLSGGPVSPVNLSDLPPKVTQVIQQRAPDAETDYITKEGSGEQVRYIVTFKRQRHAPLTIAADGTVFGESR